jgi:hypothetical protein
MHNVHEQIPINNDNLKQNTKDQSIGHGNDMSIQSKLHKSNALEMHPPFFTTALPHNRRQ